MSLLRLLEGLIRHHFIVVVIIIIIISDRDQVPTRLRYFSQRLRLHLPLPLITAIIMLSIS